MKMELSGYDDEFQQGNLILEIRVKTVFPAGII